HKGVAVSGNNGASSGRSWYTSFSDQGSATGRPDQGSSGNYWAPVASRRRAAGGRMGGVVPGTLVVCRLGQPFYPGTGSPDGVGGAEGSCSSGMCRRARTSCRQTASRSGSQ